MRRFIEWLIAFLIMAGIILLIAKAQAGEYIITTYGGGEVITIGHDGVIHAWGRGEPDVLRNEDNEESYSSISQRSGQRSFSDQERAELKEETALSTNDPEDYYMAALYYDSADNKEKAKEMAEKEIELLVARETNQSYRYAAITARQILKDKELEEFYRQKPEEIKSVTEVQ